MNETYNIRVTCIREDLFESVIETPALRVEAATLEAALLEIQRVLATWYWQLDLEQRKLTRK